MFGSTGALLGSLLFSIALPMILLVVLKLVGSSRFEWLAGIAFISGLLGGGVVGIFAGVALARGVSARTGKQSPPVGEIDV
jgi:hypothetical protein